MLRRYFCLLSIVVLYSCNLPPLSGKGNILISLKTNSKILNRSVAYSVYLPQSYNSDTCKYPVIYLLHGFGGDETSWQRRCNLAKLADSLISNHVLPKSVFVMPDGGASYFINDYQSKNRYEDFFIEEFIPQIEARFRIQKNKTSRTICGLSMGGFGAIILCVKHPDVFGNCIALSAAVRTPDEFAALPDSKYQTNFSRVYGDSLKGAERITEHWKQNSPYFLVDNNSALKLKTLNWYIDCGTEDFLFSSNTAFHELLTKYQIPNEFVSRPGNHTWLYWKSGFINGLIYMESCKNNKLVKIE
jgi:S-formylglutathione hydrolase FrmB